MKTYSITREFLASGCLDDVIEGGPRITLLTEAARRASLRSILSERPKGDVWVFAYGSLIWNPAMCFAERRIAFVSGWHRSLCVSAPFGRGTGDNPGLVLGLGAGGECWGIAFRIEERRIGPELELLWRREMLSDVYIPKWVDATTRSGEHLGTALAFTANTSSCQYESNITEEEAVRRMATASGPLGSSASYLLQTCEHLRLEGIPDLELEKLPAKVSSLQNVGASQIADASRRSPTRPFGSACATPPCVSSSRTS